MLGTVKELDKELLPHLSYSPELAICDLVAIFKFQKYAAWSETPKGVEVLRNHTFAVDVT